AALAKAYRFVGDPRDGARHERLEDLSEDPHGIYDCTHCFNCIDACPKGVAPMSQIMRLRRIAGSDEEINDRNNGHRHETALVKVAYWPGCVSRGFTPELHGAMAKVAPLLDIELVELDRGNCCGAGVIAEHNQELADTLNARTFALAQQTDGELMMNICSTCQGSMGECQERLDANADYRREINQNLRDEGLRYEKGVVNKNLAWLLVEDM